MMRWMMAMRMKVRALFGREAADRELDDELRYHVERKTEENVARGMNEQEARRQALIDAGGVEQAKEKCRDARGVRWVQDLAQDVRFALRMMRKNPGFTTVAVLTLALGIGANTVIFTLIDAILLRPLPVHDPQGLFLLQWKAHKSPKFHSISSYNDCVSRGVGGSDPVSCSFSMPFFHEVEARTDIFSKVAMWGGSLDMNVSGHGPASVATGLMVSGNYFETLGLRPAAGRVLEPMDDSPGAAPAVVLSYAYWQKVFGGDASVVGKTIGVNGAQTTIVGVAEQRFIGLVPGNSPDAWLPVVMMPQLRLNWDPTQSDDGSIWLMIATRLKPGVSQRQANAAVSAMFQSAMLHSTPPRATQENALSASLVPAQTNVVGARGQYATTLSVLMIAVGIILLIASANVAGLLLARSTGRQKEMAVRLAIGAGRARLIRQLLTESVLLSLLGAATGVLLAYSGTRAILAFVASNSTRPQNFDVSVDIRVVLFTSGIALATGILFGLAPAFRGTRVDLTPALKEVAGGSTSGGCVGRGWINGGNLLVVAQVALSMIVLVGAGLVVRTLRNLRSIDPGFDTSSVLTFYVDGTLDGYRDMRIDELYRGLQNRFSKIGGVTTASYSSVGLLHGARMTTSVRVGSPTDKSETRTDVVRVGPNFFAAMKIPVLLGHDFSQQDFVAAAAAETADSHKKSNSGNAPVRDPQPTIINETFARDRLAGMNPIGVRLFSTRPAKDDPGSVVIGVVADAKYTELKGNTPSITYVPAVARGVTFELRTAGNPAAIIPAVRSIANETDATLPFSDFRTQSETVDSLLFQERALARISSFFATLALVLACMGLYALLAYEVARRTREIGIRIALGAQRGKVMAAVAARGIALAIVGLIVGIGASIAVTRYMASLLYEVRPSDPLTFGGVAALLLIVALAACFVPARRAMRVDPMVALRHE